MYVDIDTRVYCWPLYFTLCRVTNDEFKMSSTSVERDRLQIVLIV